MLPDAPQFDRNILARDQIILRTNEDEYQHEEIIIPEALIQIGVEQLAEKMAGDLKNKRIDENILLVGVLNGGTTFTEDLGRRLHSNGITDVQKGSIWTGSYDGDSSGDLKFKIGFGTGENQVNVENMNVIIGEDIFHTGQSLEEIHQEALLHGARTVTTAVAAIKPNSAKVNYRPNYFGFYLPDTVWVVGYGMDYKDFGRTNPNIIAIRPEMMEPSNQLAA